MHKIFRKALDEATGESKFVIVVFIDIRGFSAFSQTCESPDVAMFIKRVYMKIIDEYFPFASFYKSTGDGLLLTIPFDEKNLGEISQKVIESSIKCHGEFGSICDNDPMINFRVPDKIGIGITRGTTCCLVSGDTVIDYSGRLLNLAARLTDIARLSGIVIDGAFILDLLTPEHKEIFTEDYVYLKGIHEDEPIKVYYTHEFTTITKYNKQPIAAKRWRYKKDVKPYRDLLKFSVFRYSLESQPVSPDDIKVKIMFPKIVGGKVDKKSASGFDFQDFTYKMEAGRPVVCLDYAKLSKILKQSQVKKNMNVAIEIAYVEK